MPKSKQRKKSRGSRVKTQPRRSAPSPPPFPGLPSNDPGLQRIVGKLIAEANHDLRPTDPFNAELWASHVLGIFYGRLIDVDEECLLVEAVSLAAQRRKDQASLWVCRALAAVTDADHAAELTDLGDRLATRGLAEPPWATSIGRPAFVEGWLGTEEYGDADAILAVFRYEGFGDHVLSAMVDHNLDSLLKDAFVGWPARDVVTEWHAASDIRFKAIDAAEVAARLRPALEITDTYAFAPVGDTFEEFRGIVAGRLRLALPHVDEWSSPVDPMAYDERDSLVEEFLGSPFAPDPSAREHAERLAELAMDFKCDDADGDPLRWSPVVVEIFLCDWVPRKVTLTDEEIGAFPGALRDWIRFALARRGLGPDAVAETLSAIDEFEPEFREAVGDPARFGPAKAIVNAMLADGIDPADGPARDAWIERFNALPEAERQRILG